MASTLWALARRLVPRSVLCEKVAEYVSCGYIRAEEQDSYVETLEQMHGVVREYNVHATDDARGEAAPTRDSAAMTLAELAAERSRRELLLQASPPSPGTATGQWRIYSEITAAPAAARSPCPVLHTGVRRHRQELSARGALPLVHRP